MLDLNELLICSSIGETVGILKHTDVVTVPNAVNQDKLNIVFSVGYNNIPLHLSLRLRLR